MSETFFIKKTAFDDSSNVISVREATSFIIGPGELNGPAGLARDSDLRLYGFGASKWGEGVDQNMFRLLENNACPRKELNDFNPATGNYDYNPSTDPILPKDEKDLGTGNGISTPVIGQNWFDNTSAPGLEFIYTVNGVWKPTSGIDNSGNLTITGDLTVAGSICGFTDPVIGAAGDGCAMPRLYADARYVNITGDTMTAALSMSSNKVTDVADPTADQDAATKVYVDSAISSGIPAGMGPLPWAGTAAPAGWLLCDGAAVSRTVFTALFAIVGTLYGPGDGSTTFNLPDTRGRFVLGKSPVGAGTDRVYNKNVGDAGGLSDVALISSTQLPSHNHSANVASSGAHGHQATSSTANGGHSHTITYGDHKVESGGNQYPSNLGFTGRTETTSFQADHTHTLTIASNGASNHTHSVSIGNTGSAATHDNTPPLITVNYIIKT